jgi:hypothetical protein
MEAATVSEELPNWEEIMRDLVAQGRVDSALMIAEMLAFNQFCDDLIGPERDT